MRVLVTGGAGYIGGRTAAVLRAAGHDVLVYDDLSHGSPAAVGGLPLVVGDVRDEGRLREVMQTAGTQAVVHFAALKSVEESVADPGSYFSVNVGGTLALLRAMATTDVRALVFSSSCAVYGTPDASPIDEGTATVPLNPYGESKLLAERLLPAFEAAHGLRYAALRYFNAAGAADDGESGEDWSTAPNLVPVVLRVAAGRSPALTINGTAYPTPDGTAVRDYVHVLDLADAHLRALDRVCGTGPSCVLNLGTGRGSSVREVVQAARRITGQEIATVEGPPRAGDPAAIWADPTQAHEVLGWRATRDLDDIIDTAWRWHSRHPDGYHATVPG